MFVLNRKLKNIFSKLIVLIFWAAVYQCISMAVGKELLLPDLRSVIRALVFEGTKVDFWLTVSFSILRVAAGFLSAVIFGTILAALCYRFRLCQIVFYPLISAVRSIPVASFIILALLWIKSGFVPAFIAFLMVLPLVWGNVYQGLSQTDKGLIEMADIFEFGAGKKLWLIYVPQCLPYFRTACITGLGFAWKSAIAAEVISVPAMSIGRKLYESKIYIETPELFAWTLTVAVLSFFAENVMKLIFNKLRFKSEIEKAEQKEV